MQSAKGTIEKLEKERFQLAEALYQISLVLRANSSRFIEGISKEDLALAEKIFFTEEKPE